MTEKKLSRWVAGAYALAVIAIWLVPIVVFILTGGQGIY